MTRRNRLILNAGVVFFVVFLGTYLWLFGATLTFWCLTIMAFVSLGSFSRAKSR